MIPRYNDLAANERTYLAWMRTALALIAFGFLLERFDLLVRYFAKSMSGGNILLTPPGSLIGREAGIILAALGLLLMLISTWRFVITTLRLKSDKEETYNILSVLITGGIFILLAVFVLLYISRFLNLA
jgi:putative membrane protein